MSNATMRGTSNLLSILPKRYASSAAAAAQPNQARRVSLQREPLRVTRLNNGLVVASLENNSPVTRVAAVVNAGSRDEASGQQGASHALRVFSSLATRNYSQFGLSRNLNQIGAELSVTSGREQTTYLLESTRGAVSRGIDVLGEIISRPELRHWEIDDARARLEFELDVYDEKPELRIADLAHQASFRNGLSRALYAPRYNVDSLDSELLQEFRQRNFTSNRLTLVGVGIRHEDLVRYADLFRLPTGDAKVSREQDRFLASEVRQDNLSDLVHVALTSEGASLSSKDLLASQVLSHALGNGGPRIKYSNGASRLEKAVLPSASQPAAVSSFNVNYSDAGLFGVHVVSNKNDAGKLVRGVFAELGKAAKSGLSNDEVVRAKNALKASLSYNLENSVNLIDAIALNPENANASTNLNELFRAVDAVSANDVNAFLKRVATGRHSLAATGNLSQLPRLEELHA